MSVASVTPLLGKRLPPDSSWHCACTGIYEDALKHFQAELRAMAGGEEDLEDEQAEAHGGEDFSAVPVDVKALRGLSEKLLKLWAAKRLHLVPEDRLLLLLKLMEPYLLAGLQKLQGDDEEVSFLTRFVEKGSQYDASIVISLTPWQTSL